jgi:hypothetical protein
MTEHPKTFAELYPSRFIKADHLLKGPQTYTIKSVVIQELESEKGFEKKAIVSFAETEMDWVCPTVNGVCLRAMFGDDLDDWVGKRVTLYATDKIMQLPSRKGQPAIRVYGSPDIAEPIRCEWTPARRRPLIQVLQPVQSDVVTSALEVIAKADSVEALKQIHARLADRLKEGRISGQEHIMLVKAARAREDALQPPAAPEPAPAPAPEPKAQTPKQAAIAAFEALPPNQRKKARDLFFVRFSDLPPGTIATSVTTDEHVTALAEILAGLGG